MSYLMKIIYLYSSENAGGVRCISFSYTYPIRLSTNPSIVLIINVAAPAAAAISAEVAPADAAAVAAAQWTDNIH